MNRLFAALPIVLFLPALQQAPVPRQGSQEPAPAVAIRAVRAPERLVAGTVMLVWPREFYVAGPVVSVAATPFAPGSAPVADKFSARAWQDAGRTRVVVYAVVTDRRAPNGEIETPIATFLLTTGQQVEVLETEKWGAEHVILTGVPMSDLH